jgi:hypothetical protein
MIVQGTKSLYEDLAGCILYLLSLTSIVYGIGFETCFRVLLSLLFRRASGGWKHETKYIGRIVHTPCPVPNSSFTCKTRLLLLSLVARQSQCEKGAKSSEGISLN